jgi:3-deoxy-manno-octulosonate cytidylyltransferase (CMP-KDO synthetase)
MILHVCQRATESGAQVILVATDDQRIIDVVEEAGYQAMITREDHPSGTDRIAEVVQRQGWSDDTIIVNIQGDEPLLAAADITTLVNALITQSTADVATISTAIKDVAELFDPNVVKVVTDMNDFAMYFSRATIPWDRERFPDAVETMATQHQRHIGLYAYRAGFLKRFVAMQSAPLEELEKLEQLRILWNSEPIIVASVASPPAPGVDTPEDLIRVEQIMLSNTQ